ncbi:hypothetical protein ALC57_09617 [Trachymyrmex cornetzi]|uniref:Uncharacterized protein n=1 Tax=Trachymyrmex cornetzi TaxID=471704 RepID=A0A195DZH2_9HYME|nr:hypothetical protein ALC57_09617 [Trachymyrmex cornetzi]
MDVPRMQAETIRQETQESYDVAAVKFNGAISRTTYFKFTVFEIRDLTSILCVIAIDMNFTQDNTPKEDELPDIRAIQGAKFKSAVLLCENIFTFGTRKIGDGIKRDKRTRDGKGGTTAKERQRGGKRSRIEDQCALRPDEVNSKVHETLPLAMDKNTVTTF